MTSAATTCQICGQSKESSELVSAELISPPVASTIRRTHPEWSASSVICLTNLNHFRTKYVEEVLEVEKGELSSIELEAVRSLKEQELLSANVNVEFDRDLTLGERLADRTAAFGGSWRFLIIFWLVLAAWIALN